MNIDTGEVLSPAVYEEVDMVSPTRFEVYDDKTGDYYILSLAELRAKW